jgi:tetratricopeptide (TPR) repeat protein
MNIIAQMQSASALHAAGNLAGAAKAYQQVLAVQPNQVDALRLLGLVFASQGKLQRASELIQRAVAVNPEFSAGHASLGLVLVEMGNIDAAMIASKRALELNPNMVGAHCGLGIALSKNGDTDGAITCLQRAIVLNPGAVMAYSNLGPLLHMKGDLPGSIHCYRKLCHLLPDQTQPLMQLVGALRTVEFSQFDVSLKSDLLKCFALQGVNYRDLATATASVVKLDPLLQPLIMAVNDKKLLGDLFSLETISALNDALLLQMLQKCAVSDLKLEQCLTMTRALILFFVAKDDSSEGALTVLYSLRSFIFCLAQQCFFNEYVYAQSNDEAAAIALLEVRVKSMTFPISDDDKLLIGLYGCYRPLYNLTIARDIAESDVKQAEPLFRELLKDQITSPLAELKIRAEISSLIENKDQITELVKAQYEENPFPRWKSCRVGSPASFASVIKHTLPHIDVSPELNCESPEILIAGCGTGMQAVNCSHTYKNARITAIDLSLSSLAYAKRITAELGIDNIEYIQANILELDRLDKQFDLIECGGVLHHLSNPLRGWEILSGLLKNEGVMMLAVYSKIARKAVVNSREFVAEKGYSSTLEGIRICRQALFETEDTLIRENIICAGSPFWTTSEVRDLIFHASEYQYTIPEIAETIEQIGLEFLGFVHQDPIEKARYARHFPADPDGRCLQNWHNYEQKHPRTFTNMYNFWLRK